MNVALNHRGVDPHLAPLHHLLRKRDLHPLILRPISESISPAVPEMCRDRATTCRQENRQAYRRGASSARRADPSPARQLLKALILLKADASTAGEAWSDSRIAAALDTSIDTIARTRQQLVEEGLDAALTRKHSPTQTEGASSTARQRSS
jgi:hypothetical protein